jgi:hypothetical protein
MKFARVDGERREAEPCLSGKCLVCESSMVAKCGDLRVHHWSHRAKRDCDRWWETETEWHRGWKNHFPKEWQEVIRYAEDSEKHIADVLTAGGMVLEFQHSPLRREEREARESFYKKMTWVVDGRTRVQDRAQFFKCLRTASYALPNPLTLEVRHAEGALLRDWPSSHAGVFFDFGDASEADDRLRFDTPVLWRVMPDNAKGGVYIAPVAKAAFIHAFLTSTPLGGFDSPAAAQSIAAAERARPINRPLPGSFQHYLARQRAKRSRLF